MKVRENLQWVVVNEVNTDCISSTSDGGCETGANTHCTGSGQHFRVPGLVLEDPLEGANHFAQQLRHDTRNVHKGTLWDTKGRGGIIRNPQKLP